MLQMLTAGEARNARSIFLNFVQTSGVVKNYLEVTLIKQQQRDYTKTYKKVVYVRNMKFYFLILI